LKKSPQKLIFFSSPPLRWVHTTWSRYNGARQADQKSNQIKHGIKITNTTTTTINHVWLGAIATAHRSSSHSSHEEAYLLSQTCASRQANAIHTCDASIIPIFNGSTPPSYPSLPSHHQQIFNLFFQTDHEICFDSANGSLILEKTQGFNIHLSFRFNL
jgi:hypothetical protein